MTCRRFSNIIIMIKNNTFAFWSSFPWDTYCWQIIEIAARCCHFEISMHFEPVKYNPLKSLLYGIGNVSYDFSFQHNTTKNAMYQLEKEIMNISICLPLFAFKD